MNAGHVTEDADEWMQTMREASEKRASAIDGLCRAITAGLQPMFDEEPGQRAEAAAQLEAFESAPTASAGLGSFLLADPASRRFVKGSAFGWSRPEALSAAARAAWEDAARALEPRFETRFGEHWAATQVPPPASARVSEAVLAGAVPVGTLFAGDFDATATTALAALETPLRTTLGLREQSRWQAEYWLAKPAPGPIAVPGWFARLLAWLRRLFGLPDRRAGAPIFERGGVQLDVLPRPPAVQGALWAGNEQRNEEAAQLGADVAAWKRTLDGALSDLARLQKREADALKPEPRAVSAETVAATHRRADALRRELDTAREAALRILQSPNENS